MFVLFTDTDCDITPGLKEKLGCEFISMPYTIDGKDIETCMMAYNTK